MTDRSEIAVLAAAAVLVLMAVLGGGFTPVQRLLVGVLLIVVWAVAATQWRGRLQAPELAVAGLICWGAISALWVGAAPLASKETIVAWVVAWALWVLSRRADPRSREAAARIVVSGAAAIAGAVLVTAIAMGSVRVGGAFENPNVAAAFLVPVLPLGIVVFRHPSWIRWGWFGLILCAVVLTGSRAGLLAVLVAAAILLPRGPIRILGLFAGGILAVGALFWRFAIQPDLLAWHRVSIWWAAVKIWLSRPLTGVGPGCLVEAAGPERILHPDQVGRYQFVLSFSESTPLAVMVQLGLVGVVLAVLAAGSWLVCAHRSGAFESTAFRAAALSVLTLSLFHDFLTIEPVLWWWALVLGCFEAMSRRDPESMAPAPAASLRLTAALALIWLTSWGILSPALARLISSAGPVTKTVVERSLRVEPWYPEAASRRVRDLLSLRDAWSWETAAEAAHWAKFTTRVHPGMARRWADLGRVHTRILTDLGGTDYDEIAAKKAFSLAGELDPHLPWHWLERARVERILGSHDGAIRFARRAISEEPNTVRAWLMLSRLELERGRVEAARAALLEATSRAILIDRAGLNDYERELLFSPQQQVQALQRELRLGD